LGEAGRNACLVFGQTASVPLDSPPWGTCKDTNKSERNKIRKLLETLPGEPLIRTLAKENTGDAPYFSDNQFAKLW
jgi:hypothetical protein